MADERTKAIDLAFAQIEKQFGKGSIMRLGSKEAIVPISVIPTGAISFDAALGVGGFPRGRVVEIFGPESSGKTTIALQVIAEAQKTGGMAAFVDAEHALDPAWEQSTCWSWIQSRHWCPRPNLTEKWATATWGFRRV